MVVEATVDHYVLPVPEVVVLEDMVGVVLLVAVVVVVLSVTAVMELALSLLVLVVEFK